jgi:signal transduction histidine kinase/DNA-binding response OmpR family regulator/streptogramin lyase
LGQTPGESATTCAGISLWGRMHTSSSTVVRASVLRRWLLGLLSLLVGIVGSARQAQGQETRPLRRFTTHDGLPHESIRSLAQTPDGRLWVGTQAGLAVYDGRKFRTIPFPDSLGQSRILNVVAMPDGSVWAAPQSGLGLVQVRGLRVVRVEQVPANEKVGHLFAKGDTLVATSTRAVWTLSPKASRFRKHPLPYEVTPPENLAAHPNSGTGITGAELGPGGSLWILDGRFGPGRFSLDGSVDFLFRSPSTAPLWTSFGMGEDGRALLTRRGAHRLWAYHPDDESFQVLLGDLEGQNSVIREGHTAYVTDSRGFRRMDLRTNTTLQPLNRGSGVPPKRPTSVLEDRAGTVWIGTRSGLLHLHAPSVRCLQSVAGTQVSNANLFMMAAGGELWAQTYGSGLLRLRPTRQAASPDGHEHWGQGVRSVDGRAHAHTQAGWYRYDPQESSSWQRVGPTAGAVRGYVDSSGIGYFFHNDGLYRHNPSAPDAPRALYRWPSEDRAAYQVTRSPGERLLVRARDWLLELHPERAGPVQVDTIAHLPGFEEVGGRYMAATRTGDVWIVGPDQGRRGLLHLSIEADRPRPHFHLSGESVYNVSLSGDSLVLGAARSGLFLLDAQTGTQRRQLTRGDGLLNTSTRDAALVGDSLYASHSTGFTVIPREIAFQRPSPPAATITGLTVNREPRPVRTPLSLAASERTLEVDYAAPSLRNPQRVAYEYRLLSRDTTWRATSQPTLQIASLKPGQHRLEVRARIGPSTGPPAHLEFTVAPFFYETWWFWGLCALGLGGLGALGYRWRIEHLEHRKETLEQTVAQRTRDLRAEKEKTEQQAERLAELDEAKNQFFANLSHEFRTPLTLITEPLRGLLRNPTDPLPDAVREQLRPMLRNAERLERLIDQLITLSKSTAGQLELRCEPVDLVALARNCFEAFVPLAERHDIELHFRSDLDTLPASADPDKLHKILSNLLSNAIKFTEADGTVWLTVTRAPDSDEEAHLVVKDTGLGISEPDLRRIFDRFEQVDGSTTRPQEGTGIGLALTRDLVELHDGTVGVESEPGTGSAFTVRLPLGDPPLGDATQMTDAVPGDGAAERAIEDASVSESSPTRVPDGTGEAPTLLVVDDNADVCAFLRRELGDAYAIDTAATGTEALDQMRASAPDAVVSDVMMAEMDGFELCKAIKADEELRTIPVLLLTARAEADDAVEGLECGADDYLTKPFDVRELRQRIGRLLEVRSTLQSEYEQTVRVEQVGLVVPATEAAFVDAVLTAITEAIDDPDFTVDRLADAVALSRRQLTRRLREATDESPAALIRRVRLERAATHLEDTKKARIADVAYAVGFRTVSHFSRAFKKHFGCPPSQYPDES